MHRLTKFYIGTFLLQGVLSLGEAFFFPGQDLILRFSSGPMVLLSLVLYLGMWLTPRLSKRLLLPPVLFTFWSAAWALPLSLYLPNQSVLLVAAFHTLLGLLLYLCFADWSRKGWVLRDYTARRPAFSFTNFLGSTFFTACFLALLLGLFAHAGSYLIEQKTDGYVRLDPSGVSLEERRFRLGDKEVRLVGMVHIARRNFYDEIAHSLPPHTPALVLLEGISDRKNLLEKKFGYSKVAAMLGLTSQSDSSFHREASESVAGSTAASDSDSSEEPASPPLIQYRRADIDVAAFQKSTIQFLQAMGALMASNTVREALQKLEDPNSPIISEGEGANVMADILDKRNEHLISELEAGLVDHNLIVIPWGAMHLPAIQAQLTLLGFVESKRIRRQAMRFKFSAATPPE